MSKYINVEKIKEEYEGLTEEQQVEKLEGLTGRMIMAQVEIGKKSEPTGEDMLKMADIFAEMGVAMTLDFE